MRLDIIRNLFLTYLKYNLIYREAWNIEDWFCHLITQFRFSVDRNNTSRRLDLNKTE